MNRHLVGRSGTIPKHHTRAEAQVDSVRLRRNRPTSTSLTESSLAVSVQHVFTGIVEELGSVASRSGSRLRITAKHVLSDSAIGASIAVNGCCLTVVQQGEDWWEADVSEETFRRTALGDLQPGSPVNLERPMAANGRFGGHVVLGHVDLVGEVVSPAPNLRVRIGRDQMHLLVEKGSITVDGISLTAFGLDDDSFEVAVIPHTTQVTTLGVRRAGDKVNIEMDVLAKHVERLMSARGVKRRMFAWWRK